ncbi:NodT family efflux transporter outer membrane factor (OMF) lipoprotein [Sphingomonas trueperi]
MFNDPALDALVDQALAGNLDVKIAAARVEEARAQLESARASLRPTLASAAAPQTSRSLSPFGVGVDQDSAQAQFTTAYEVDLFGRLRQTRTAARDELLAAADARDAVRISMIAMVIQGYFSLQATDARLEIIRRTIQERQLERDLIHRRFTAGYASQLEDQQADAALEAAIRLSPSTELIRAQQESALSQLIGVSPTSIRRGPFPAPDGLAVPASVPSQVLEQRPDIAAAALRLSAADHSLAASRAAFMPRLQLSGSAGAVASTLLSSPVSLFALGGSVLAPIFQGGALRANRNAAAARRDEAAFGYKSAVLQAFREVEDAMASVRFVSQEAEAADRQVVALEGAYHAAQRRYQAGYASYLEQLDSERALLSARLDQVDLRLRRLTALVALNRSVGGGWSSVPSGQLTDLPSGSDYRPAGGMAPKVPSANERK